MKNKVILITALAAAMAPMAVMSEADIYGQLRYSINSVDDDKGAASTKDGLRGEDNVSLFGIKASTEGDGIKAFIHLQTGASADSDPAAGDNDAFKQRFYFGGLSGAFGKVAYGRMTNAYKFPGFKLDPFYNLSHVGAGGALAAGGATYGLSGATNGFTNNALQYTSPSFSGLKVNVGIYIDDDNEDEHGTNAGASYSSGKFNVGVQMASNGDKTAGANPVPNLVNDGDAMRLHGGYKADNWSAGFSFENVDIDPLDPTNVGASDADYIYLVGKYNATKETQLVLTVGSVSDGAAEGSGFNAGVFHTVAPQTQLFVLHSTASLDNVTTGEDPSVTSFGAIHKF